MTAKAFFTSILCLTAVFAHLSNAADPDEAHADPGASALFERKTAGMILDEVRTLDLAVRQWGLENRHPASATPKPTDLAVYFKQGSRLHAELSAGQCNDLLGNPITLRGVDRAPLLSKATVQQFAALAGPGNWGPFYEGPAVTPGPLAPANPTTKEELRITADRLAEEMLMLESAVEQWTIEHNKPKGAQALPADLLYYLKQGTRLHSQLAAGRTNDSLGNPIKIPPMGKNPTISPATAIRLAPVVPPGFWGRFATK